MQWRRRWRASGFDIEAVLDGDVEVGDGGGGDGEVVSEGAQRLYVSNGRSRSTQT